MYKYQIIFTLLMVMSPVRYSHQSIPPMLPLLVNEPPEEAEIGPEQPVEEPNQFLDAAKGFLEEALEKNPEIAKNSGLNALGGILQMMKNTGGGSKLSDLLSGLNLPAGSNNGKGVAADILAGIAGMLDKNSEGGFDPSLLNQVADVLGNVASAAEQGNEITGSGGKSAPNWGSILGVVSTLMTSMGDKNGEGGSLEGFLNLLPMLTGNTPSGHVHFADNELEDAAEHEKSKHQNYKPPFMHIFTEFWEHFKRSEFGEAVWRKSGLESIFMMFVDDEGYFQVDKIFESMEDTSFRRKWVKSLSSFVGEWVNHISDPQTQNRYLATIKFYGNSFLRSQGYPKSVQFDPMNPAESIIVIADAVFKRNFGLEVNSGKYIRPAVTYLTDIFKSTEESKGILSFAHFASQDLGTKLGNLVNGDLIEPVLRVWKAYKFMIKNPECDRRLICYLNQKGPDSNTGLKPAVIKLSSIIASWYASGRTGTPFWKFYNAATEDVVCEVHYPADCQAFYDEDVRFTTESIHSEEL